VEVWSSKFCRQNKGLFGTMDESDAEYYDEQIRHFERNSEDTTELLKKQAYVIKSTLGTLNITLADVTQNDKLLKQGLVDRLTWTHYLQRLPENLLFLKLSS